MANVDFPKGFRAMSNQHGTAPQTHEYSVAASTTVYAGSPVMLNGSGLVVIYTGLTANLSDFIGVAVHGRKAADTARELTVYDDPNQEYEVQFDSATNGVTTVGGLIGVNFSMATPAGGNNTLMQSTAEVDESTGSAVVYTATTLWPVKGLRFASDPQNSRLSTASNIVVRFNNKVHVFSADNAGI